jgi:hypothetical protein
MSDMSLYDCYVNGMLDDLYAAQASGDQIAIDAARLQLRDFQEHLERKIAATKTGGGHLKALYVVASPIVTAYHTEAQVNTEYPDCGPNNRTLDEVYKDVSTALDIASKALKGVPVYGTVASYVAKVASIAVTIFGQRHQSNASCADAVALVPACLNLEDYDIQAWVGQNQNPLANPKIDAYHDNWWGYKHVDVPELTKGTVSVMVPSKDPKHDAGVPCKFKVLRVRLRNWSNNENLQLYFRAYWDAPMKDDCSHCADFGMVSEIYRDTWLLEGKDDLKAYLGRMYDKATKYDREYRKAHP